MELSPTVYQTASFMYDAEYMNMLKIILEWFSFSLLRCFNLLFVAVLVSSESIGTAMLFFFYLLYSEGFDINI